MNNKDIHINIKSTGKKELEDDGKPHDHIKWYGDYTPKIVLHESKEK